MTAAVIVAAGRGLRLGGDVPKGMRALAGRPLYAYSLDAARSCALVEYIVLVVPTEFQHPITAELASGAGTPVLVVAGGDTRQKSVQLGLSSLPPTATWVAVHDAARPLVTSTLFQEVIRRAQETGGAMAAHPATDTIKRIAPGARVITLPREELWHAETPQVFPRDALMRALANCERDSIHVTDEAEAMERAGHRPALYHNPAANPKISTESDLLYIESLVRSQ